jgi:peptidoglycan/xylan/chitin deacetylase (PgdA/CDA1 family)
LVKRLVKIGIAAVYYSLWMKPRFLLGNFLGRRFRRLVILCYHGVRPEERPAFSWQMDALLRAGSPVFPDEVPPDGGKDLLVAVTFDDGFENILRDALPVLREKRIPAMIFVPSGCLGGEPMWPVGKGTRSRGVRVLEREELREIARPFVKIGSHTVSHADLTELGTEEAFHELRRSREDLEAIVGTPVELVAFPYGKCTEQVAEQARRAGYRHGLTMEPEATRPGRDGFLLGRFRIDPSDWKIESWLKVRGAYEGSAPFQRWKKYFGRSPGLRRFLHA